MLQIKTFVLPDEEDAANEFLKTHKPLGNIEFTKDILFMGYEDGTYPAEYQIADLMELIAGQRNARLQQEIMLQVLKSELSDLNPKQNANAYQEKLDQIRQVERGMDTQDLKIGFVEAKIKALKASLEGATDASN